LVEKKLRIISLRCLSLKGNLRLEIDGGNKNLGWEKSKGQILNQYKKINSISLNISAF